MLLSSGVVLDVILNLIPKILLVSQMMFCCIDVQRVVKVQQVLEQRQRERTREEKNKK